MLSLLFHSRSNVLSQLIEAPTEVQSEGFFTVSVTGEEIVKWPISPKALLDVAKYIPPNTIEVLDLASLRERAAVIARYSLDLEERTLSHQVVALRMLSRHRRGLRFWKQGLTEAEVRNLQEIRSRLSAISKSRREVPQAPPPLPKGLEEVAGRSWELGV